MTIGVWQKVLCVGDSQTFGARSRAGYPEYLSEILRVKTDGKVEWICVNEGVNHETVLQIMRRTDRALRTFGDAFMVCLLAGTNDTRGDVLTPIELFGELYRQLLVRIMAEKKILFPATIPIPQTGFGHLPYTEEAGDRAREINCVIENLVEQLNLTDNLVRLEDLSKAFFVDAVHFNDAGCQEIARRFSEKILERSV